MTSEEAHTIAEQVAAELGAVWGLAIRQRARFAGGRLDARQTYRASLRVARRRGWLRYQCGGHGVKAVYAPAGLSRVDVERLTGAPALHAEPRPLGKG